MFTTNPVNTLNGTKCFVSCHQTTAYIYSLHVLRWSVLTRNLVIWQLPESWITKLFSSLIPRVMVIIKCSQMHICLSKGPIRCLSYYTFHWLLYYHFIILHSSSLIVVTLLCLIWCDRKTKPSLVICLLHQSTCPRHIPDVLRPAAQLMILLVKVMPSKRPGKPSLTMTLLHPMRSVWVQDVVCTQFQHIDFKWEIQSCLPTCRKW